MKTVYVVGIDYAITKMFKENDWRVSDSIESHLDLIVFTGGEDLNPRLYGEKPQGAVGWNDHRDQQEKMIYNKYVNKIPMAGICRGGQFLNVMNGGKMIQHIPNHAGDHDVFIEQGFYFGGVTPLREGHHQGMIEGPNAVVIGTDVRDQNREILYYPETKSFCFQAHPEWQHKNTETMFFNLLEEFIYGEEAHSYV